MTMDDQYYTLSCCQDDAFNKRGKQIANCLTDLMIGQTEYCHLRIPNDTQYEDAELALVRKSTTAEGWILLSLSPYAEHDVTVNGNIISTLYPLKDGDVIGFVGQRQELRFRIHTDNQYKSSEIMIIESRLSLRMIGMLLLFPILITVVAIEWLGNHGKLGQLTADMVEDIRASVYQLKVDSIQYLSIKGTDTVVIDCCETDIAETAFFTIDSLLVTARHSIEPWLNVNERFLVDSSRTAPLYAQWALMAETHNQYEEDSSKQQLISYCTLFRCDTVVTRVYSTRSSDFFMDKSRDVVLEIGDYDNLRFWRSISSRPRRIDMMMGDIAFQKIQVGTISGHTGTIRLAGEKQFKELWQLNNYPLSFWGFPKSEHVGGKQVEMAEGHLAKRFLISSDNQPLCPLYHDRKLSQGFSGGPVMVRLSDGCYAVSVVSVTDKNNSERTYSIPVTEITNSIGYDGKE